MPVPERGQEREKRAVMGERRAAPGVVRLVEPVADFPALA